MDKLVLSVFFCTRILISVGSDLQIRFFISLRFIQYDISACHSGGRSAFGVRGTTEESKL
jgi:hypothetical protein